MSRETHSVNSSSSEKFDEEIACLITVGIHTVQKDKDHNLSSSMIPTDKFYSRTKRPKPRANVTIALEEFNGAKKRRKRKGARLCMPTKRRTRHCALGGFDEISMDDVCAFVPPERHASVGSGLDMADNVDNDLFSYGKRYKAQIGPGVVSDFLSSRTMRERSGDFVLQRQHGDNSISFPKDSRAGNYRCPCCPEPVS